MLKKNALFIGRFQPLHNGHIDALKQIIERSPSFENVVIVISSSNNTTNDSQNPFSTEERVEMLGSLSRELKTETTLIRIVPVPDNHDPSQYAEHVRGCVKKQTREEIDITPESTVLIVTPSTSPYIVDCFTTKHQPSSFETLKVDQRTPIRGNDIRQMMATGIKAWMALVPRSTARTVVSCDGEARVNKVIGKRKAYRNPTPTADVIIEGEDDKVVLIERKHAPFGWALPGGFVNYGEDVWDGARREANEETGITANELALLNVYGRPDRDTRFHTQTTVFIAPFGSWKGTLSGADDAKSAMFFTEQEITTLPVAFDHRSILNDFFQVVKRQHKQPLFKHTW